MDKPTNKNFSELSKVCLANKVGSVNKEDMGNNREAGEGSSKGIGAINKEAKEAGADNKEATEAKEVKEVMEISQDMEDRVDRVGRVATASKGDTANRVGTVSNPHTVSKVATVRAAVEDGD